MIIQKAREIQNKIEKKFQKFNNISFERFLYAIIAGCVIQAAIQYLMMKTPDPWLNKTEIEMFGDPAFYLGLTLTFMIALLIIRKWNKK